MDNFEIRELAVRKEGQDIHAIVYLPNAAKDGKRCPVIIYAHGMTGNHESGDVFAREFAKRGYVVCCFDFCGGQGSRSDGDPLDMTVFTEQADLEAVYDALVKQPYADANNVFLMGSSMGGAVAALTAGNRAGVIKGLILLYPAFNLSDEVARKVTDPFDIPQTAQFATTVGRDFLDSLYGFDLIAAASAYRGPVLILHGTDDDVVESSYSLKAAKAYRRADLELIAGAGHGFSGGQLKYAIHIIVDFLDEETDLADESGLEGDLNLPSGMGAFGGMGL